MLHVLMPVYCNLSIESFSRSPDVCQIAYRTGTYFYFLHSRFSLNGADTRQRVEEPFINLPHHKVIPRRTLSRIPLLGQRGSSKFQLETLPRGLFMVMHGVHQLIQSVTG